MGQEIVPSSILGGKTNIIANHNGQGFGIW